MTRYLVDPAIDVAEVLRQFDPDGARRRVLELRTRPATSRDRDAAARGDNVVAGYGPPPPAPGERCPRCHRTAPRADGIPCALCAPPPAALGSG